jgi:hypothetical protein
MLTALLVLIHVIAAFAFVAGYVATNGLTEAARRTRDSRNRRTILALSGGFDRRLVRNCGTVVGLSGLALVAVGSAPVTSVWIWLSAALYASVVGLGIRVWGPRGGAVEAAIAASDDPTAERLLNEPRFVILSRIENAALVLVVCLMVVRPM